MTRARIGPEPIDPAALLASVASVAQGATVLFLGTVRDHADGKQVQALEYSAYEAMAQEELGRIVAEAAARWPGTALAVQHRLGLLALGDVSVGVAASHAHRAPAFEAARHVIEELKQRVPVWKREHFADGSQQWVAQAPAGAGTTT